MFKKIILHYYLLNKALKCESIKPLLDLTLVLKREMRTKAMRTNTKAQNRQAFRTRGAK
ncbi:hypothetical protein HanRHA438_Chr15g0718761 [Helianthus annuus]|nr:hypothetical protein HanRHA438_Chr15g0718761 [Helianthus annuus]